MFHLRMIYVSLFRNGNREIKFFSVPYHHYIRNFAKMFKDQGITILFKSNQMVYFKGTPKTISISKNLKYIKLKM